MFSVEVRDHQLLEAEIMFDQLPAEEEATFSASKIELFYFESAGYLRENQALHSAFICHAFPDINHDPRAVRPQWVFDSMMSRIVLSIVGEVSLASRTKLLIVWVGSASTMPSLGWTLTSDRAI